VRKNASQPTRPLPSLIDHHPEREGEPKAGESEEESPHEPPARSLLPPATGRRGRGSRRRGRVRKNTSQPTRPLPSLIDHRPEREREPKAGEGEEEHLTTHPPASFSHRPPAGEGGGAEGGGG